ncbi:AraC family transcriptional regulator [Tessaracoccus antarcticus]|uniref:AraC family transcriptional regulator n=1 Tax=Tessaracoccus antarcticus TaxID=2479848 RepID=A0A3M0GA13_9ACTN|nr:AraC family transcriptional regulator [Tessaracoccus antarcticus]RMB61790.1 AraC family transcriptional regulator [Tessaracoccus antarcticus]
MLVRDGFPGQRLRVLSAPTVEMALRSPLTERLLVTDAGYFPHAAAHGRIRRHGARETIVIVCVAGRGRIKLDNTLHDVGPGEVAVILPEVPHMYMADEADPWSIWWLHVTGSDVEEFTQLIRHPGGGPTVRLRDSHRAIACIERVIDALEIDDTHATLYEASGAAWQLMAYIAADVQRGKKTLATDSIRLVQDYLRANLASSLGVPELARMASLSTSHFSALFRAATGMTVTEYLKRLRSARARELLITTSATIAEVAERVGYSDAFYFSRQFRAINSISPREFRRRHLDNSQPTIPGYQRPK